MKKILFFIFSLLITFTSCKEEEPLPISVESVKLNHSSITLVIGESDMLIATVSPNNAENKRVSWSSSDKNVATVIDGEVTAIKEGETVIKVQTEDGGHTAKCVVTVKKDTDDDDGDDDTDDDGDDDDGSIPVESISLDNESLSMVIGEEQILTATIYPSNATNCNIIWESSSPDVVSVDNGKVIALSVGSSEITAKTEDGGYTATCNITVSSEVLWGIIGSMNEFGETELIMSEDDYENYYVRRNVSMDMYDYFVFFNYDGSEEYYGTYSEDDFAPINNKISIVKEGFSFVVADAGTYDVFLDKSLKCCYIMV